MNTRQLIVSWYACYAIVAVLLRAGARSGPSHVGYFVGAIVLSAALLVYSLSSHSKAVRRTLLAWTLIPPSACFLLFLALLKLDFDSRQEKRISVPLSQLEIVGLAIEPDDRSLYTYLRGRARNRSTNTLKWLGIEVAVLERGEVIERTRVDLSLDVPAKEARDFRERLYLQHKDELFHDPKGERFSWNYNIFRSQGLAAAARVGP